MKATCQNTNKNASKYIPEHFNGSKPRLEKMTLPGDSNLDLQSPILTDQELKESLEENYG